MRHKTAWHLATIAGIVCSTLLGCASPALDARTTTLALDGMVIVMAPLTAGTWTARAQDSTSTLPRSTAGTAQLRRAIEAASGCRVTDSDYSEGGRQFNAQLACPASTR